MNGQTHSFAGVSDHHELAALHDILQQIAAKHRVNPDSERGRSICRKLLRLYGHGLLDDELMSHF